MKPCGSEPDLADAHYNLGNLLKAMGRYRSGGGAVPGSSQIESRGQLRSTTIWVFPCWGWAGLRRR